MSHTIIDPDLHFIVNADDRSITNESGGILTIMQYDHNSERATFEFPRYIEGHDMFACNFVLVLFDNTSKGTSASNRSISSGVYKVTDLAIKKDHPDTLTCSWLIAREATQYVGTLTFQLQIVCYENEEAGIPEYYWHTDKCTMINVKPSLNSGNEIVEAYPDAFTQFDKRVSDLEANGVPQDRLAAAIDEYFAENPVEKLTEEELRVAIDAYFVDHPTDEIDDEYIEGVIAQYLKDHPIEGGAMTTQEFNTRVENYISTRPMDSNTESKVNSLIAEYLENNFVDGNVTQEELIEAIRLYFIDYPIPGLTDEVLAEAIENYFVDHPIPSGATGSGQLPLEYYADMFTTSKKIWKYDNGDESDDIFMRFEGANAVWYRGICTGEIETIDNLYWIDENHTALTTQETDYPVEVYIYDEHVRMQVEITNDETHGPKWTFGEGGGYDDPTWGKSFLEKTATTTEFYQVSDSGKKNGIFISNNYTDIVGERMPTKMAWSGNTLNVTYQGGKTRTFAFSDDLSTLTVDGHTISLEGFQ